MLAFRRKLLLNLFKLSDICTLIAALLIASWVVTYSMNWITLKEFLSLRVKVVNFILFLGMILLWHLLFNSFHLYHSRRLGSRLQESKDILKAITIGTAIFILAEPIFNISLFTPLFISVSWLSSTILTLSFRNLLRYALKKVRFYGRNLRFVLTVGTNKRAYDFSRSLEEKKELGYRMLGYIDKKIYSPKEGVKLLGTMEDFPTIIKNQVVDEVVIALPIKSHYEEIQRIVQKAEEQGIIVRYLSQLFDTKIAKSRAEVFEDFTVMTVVSRHQDGWQYLAKQARDMMLGTALIILTFPIMVCTAIAIKLTSSGPIFFVQDRVGFHNRIFRLYKFRTMIADAEKMQDELEDLNERDGPVFKIQNDPRITTVGRLLRKTSIDELPQLFNVIRGDMSLVGPRPLPIRDYSGFNQDWQRRRFSVLPGITCTWQTTDRNKISFEDWMKLDMEYIDNWTLNGDMKILVKTIPAVIRGKGAV